jgi:hypothetical protein
MDEKISLDQLIEAFQSGLTPPVDISQALDMLLSATGGCAIGMWHRVDRELQRIGFRCDDQFPRDVAKDFAATTQVVSLDLTGLGIVHATVTKRPAVALLPSLGGRLPGSGGWLEKFQAQQSLSIPILRGEEVVAVLALSTRFQFGEQDRTWILTAALAAKLSEHDFNRK